MYFFLLQFYSLLERNGIANITLELQDLTIFAPTNQAFQTFESMNDGESDANLVLYHMSK